MQDRCQHSGCNRAALPGLKFCPDHIGDSRPPNPMPPNPTPHGSRRLGSASTGWSAYGATPAPIEGLVPDLVKVLERINRNVTKRSKPPKRKRKG
jgi:hypothetical protein